MNKRSLLFVVLVSIVFFGLNLYFGYSRDKNERMQQKELSVEKQKEAEALKKEIAAKCAPLTDLPIVTITEDQAGSKTLGYGIEVQGNTLSLAWQKTMPTTVFVKGIAQNLITRDFVVEGPVFYTHPHFKQLEIAAVPQVGTYDIQLISFPPHKLPVSNFAQYRDGTLYFPCEPLCCNALALFKTESGYLPFGFYAVDGRVLIELQRLPLLAHLPIHRLERGAPEPLTGTEPAYYVLENPYLQLVFTDVGGALAEINLPFESDNNRHSVVKQIGFDRQIEQAATPNAYFPEHPYKIAGSDQIHPRGSLGGYYPLLRRDLFIKDKIAAISPQHFATNLVSEYPEMAQLRYQVKEFSKEKIVFEAVQSYRRITKTYTLSADGAPYVFDLNIQIEGDGRNLFLSSGVPEVEIMSNASSPQIQYRLTRKDSSSVEKLDLPKVNELITVSSISPDWSVNSNGYLGMILTPLNAASTGLRAQAIEGAAVPTRLVTIDPAFKRFSPSSYPGYEILLPLNANSRELAFRIYAGPFEEKTLKAVDQYYQDKTSHNPDYISAWTFYGWFSFLTEPLAKALFFVMKFFYMITHSWAASIILLTVFLRLVLYPLNGWSMKSMQRMREVSPEVQALQKKYKKDPKKAQMEVMALYREKKINPMSGCFPLLIQLPFLIAMFDLLKSSFQLRGASFIPGWIDNLTAPDVLFSWREPIFFIGTEFHLLPFILGAVMLLQQRVSSPVVEGQVMTDQERQQRTMGTMMAVLFTVMFYNFPSGLNIYWLSSMLLGIGQQWLTNHFSKSKKSRVKKGK